MDERLITSSMMLEDEQTEYSLRPRFLNEYIGQHHVKEHMRIYIEAAKHRGEPLDHALFYGPPGLGKTTLASALAIRSISWNAEQLTGEEKVVLTFLPGKGPPRDDLQRAWLRERGKFDFREANRILTVSLSTDKANVLAELVALLSNNENCH